MKTKTQILLETFKYYEEDPTRRGIKKGSSSCVYKTQEGNKCALGLRINEDRLKAYGLTLENLNTHGNVVELTSFLKNQNLSIDNILFDDYIGHDHDFWLDVQKFHDGSSLWDNGSEEEKEVNRTITKGELLTKYKNL